MSASGNPSRLPHSIRKHLRLEKARLRRELPAEEARRAIEQLLRGVKRSSGAQSGPGKVKGTAKAS